MLRRQLSLLVAGALLISVGTWLPGCGSSDGTLSTTANANPETEGRADLTIRTGTSFGECMGYCYLELTIQDGRVTAVEKTWDGSEPELTNTATLDRDDWTRLQELAKPELLADVPAVLGCPDCADGGAEWVEIQTKAMTERVTFEYEGSVEELEALLPLLRELRRQHAPRR